MAKLTASLTETEPLAIASPRTGHTPPSSPSSRFYAARQATNLPGRRQNRSDKGFVSPVKVADSDKASRSRKTYQSKQRLAIESAQVVEAAHLPDVAQQVRGKSTRHKTMSSFKSPMSVSSPGTGLERQTSTPSSSTSTRSKTGKERRKLLQSLVGGSAERNTARSPAIMEALGTSLLAGSPEQLTERNRNSSLSANSLQDSDLPTASSLVDDAGLNGRPAASGERVPVVSVHMSC
jgi:hypothetical protein